MNRLNRITKRVALSEESRGLLVLLRVAVIYHLQVKAISFENFRFLRNHQMFDWENSTRFIQWFLVGFTIIEEWFGF